MTDSKDNKLAKMMNKINKTADVKADLTPTKTLEKKAKAKLRTKKVSSYVTKDEKETLLSLIGRQSESDAIRELVLKFINESKK